ncbi:MAG TPA: class I SAM-dependent methyltransferase [Puia sp.]|jgi:predicted O-methyltransferase YrrM
MNDAVLTDIPVQYDRIKEDTTKLSFQMNSDLYTGSLLKTLVASKKSGRILELGTGGGLATSWILKGMDQHSDLLTVENNAALWKIASGQLRDDRIEFILADGYVWLKEYMGEKFDLIFADAMPGKYDLFEETIRMLKSGGFYILDDMMPQVNWPVGHAEKVDDFIHMLESRKDLVMTKMNWSTGIIIAVKI